MPPNVGKAKAAVAPIYDKVTVNQENITDELQAIYTALKIDPSQLPEEAQNHPMTFARIATMSAEAKSERDYAKRRMDMTEARTDSRIRRESALDGAKKPTEAQIKNEVTLDDEVAQATEDWLESCRAADILEGLRQSCKDRRDLLVELMRDARHEAASYGSGKEE